MRSCSEGMQAAGAEVLLEALRKKQRFQNELRKLLWCHWLTSRLRLPQELAQRNNAVFTYLELASARSPWMRNVTINLDNSGRVDLENC